MTLARRCARVRGRRAGDDDSKLPDFAQVLELIRELAQARPVAYSALVPRAVLAGLGVLQERVSRDSAFLAESSGAPAVPSLSERGAVAFFERSRDHFRRQTRKTMISAAFAPPALLRHVGCQPREVLQIMSRGEQAHDRAKPGIVTYSESLRSRPIAAPKAWTIL